MSPEVTHSSIAVYVYNIMMPVAMEMMIDEHACIHYS